ncbi:MAG: GldM family protein, partial [Bacteroidota bacterium]
KPGTATIVVSGGGLQPTTFEYRVKRIPDPVMYLGKSKGGSMNVAEFKVHAGLAALLEGFDFNAKAEVRSYEVVRLRKGDAATAENRGAKYGDDVRRLVESAQRGDVFFL